ncbi:MAG: hypothetical protein V4475_06785 [Pseudomonadota bacterium]
MTRMRSPNYPAIPLKQAIDLAGKIFKSDRTNTIDKDVAAQHMGFAGLNGRTLKLLGALSQYALLDKVGKGNVRISKTAVSILHGLNDTEKKDALALAAASPPLFKRIRDTFDQPSDKTITSFLMKEGFTDRAVAPVLKSFNETNSFLAASGVSESYGDAADGAPDSDPEDDDVPEDEDDEVTEVGVPPAGAGAGASKGKPKQFAQNEIALNSTKPIFDFETVRIETVIDNPDDLAELIQRLEQIKGMLPPKKHDL